MTHWRAQRSIRWQPMKTAPRDGSEIEIKCSYGTVPWVRKARWRILPWLTLPIWEFEENTFIEDVDFGRRCDGANNSNLQWRHPHVVNQTRLALACGVCIALGIGLIAWEIVEVWG